MMSSFLDLYFFFFFLFFFCNKFIERWIFKWNIGGVSGLRLLRLFFGKLFNARIDFYIAY